MQNFKRIAADLDVSPLLKKLETMPELWREITIRQEFSGSAHHDTETIFLRGPKAFTPQNYFGEFDSFNYPAMYHFGNEIVNLLHPVLCELQCTEFGRMMIVKLKPGGTVDPHIDEGLYADHFSRFHIVLKSDLSTLTAGDETCHFEPGECWWFNHKVIHSAHNFSKTVPRIHLIFDAVTPFFKVGENNE